MTITEFYKAVGGSYNEVINRLMTDKRILTYLNKFVSAGDYSELLNAIDAEDWETGFRASHNLKGVSLNLGLGDLAKSSSELCETMRPGKKPEIDITSLLEQVKVDYAKTVALIPEVEN